MKALQRAVIINENKVIDLPHIFLPLDLKPRVVRPSLKTVQAVFAGTPTGTTQHGVLLGRLLQGRVVLAGDSCCNECGKRVCITLILAATAVCWLMQLITPQRGKLAGSQLWEQLLLSWLSTAACSCQGALVNGITSMQIWLRTWSRVLAA